MKIRRPPSFHWCDRRLMLLLQEYDQTVTVSAISLNSEIWSKFMYR